MSDLPSVNPVCIFKGPVILGLHASITTHICAENLNQQTGEWGADLQCYVDRVASHPERLQNIYFNTVLLLRALRKVGPYLSAYNICSGDLVSRLSHFLMHRRLSNGACE